jgi:hypothetical protein
VEDVKEDILSTMAITINTKYVVYAKFCINQLFNTCCRELKSKKKRKTTDEVATVTEFTSENKSKLKKHLLSDDWLEKIENMRLYNYSFGVSLVDLMYFQTLGVDTISSSQLGVLRFLLLFSFFFFISYIKFVQIKQMTLQTIGAMRVLSV